jgi:hypothetical protein
MVMRTAPVGTLNTVPPTLTGNRSGVLDPFALQVGHNRYATSTIAPAVIPQAKLIGSMWMRPRQLRGPRRAVENAVSKEGCRIIAWQYAMLATRSGMGIGDLLAA